MLSMIAGAAVLTMGLAQTREADAAELASRFGEAGFLCREAAAGTSLPHLLAMAEQAGWSRATRWSYGSGETTRATDAVEATAGGIRIDVTLNPARRMNTCQIVFHGDLDPVLFDSMAKAVVSLAEPRPALKIDAEPYGQGQARLYWRTPDRWAIEAIRATARTGQADAVAARMTFSTMAGND